jgi:hypothetical protein
MLSKHSPSYLQRKALLVTFGDLAKSDSQASFSAAKQRVAERSRSIDPKKRKKLPKKVKNHSPLYIVKTQPASQNHPPAA